MLFYRKKKKQRGGRVTLLIKQCGHVYMTCLYGYLYNNFFVCFFVCLFFGRFLVKKKIFFQNLQLCL